LVKILTERKKEGGRRKKDIPLQLPSSLFLPPEGDLRW